MRREIVGGCLQLTAYAFFTVVLLRGDVSRWIIALGIVLIILQTLRLAQLVVRAKRQRTQGLR